MRPGWIGFYRYQHDGRAAAGDRQRGDAAFELERRLPFSAATRKVGKSAAASSRCRFCCRPSRLLENRLRRPELQRPRRRTEQAAAEGAAARLQQAVERRHRRRRSDPAAARSRRAVDHEAEPRRRHRPSCPSSEAGQRLGLRPRADLRQRRDRARIFRIASRSYTRCKGFDTFAPIGPCVAAGLDGSPAAWSKAWSTDRRQSSRHSHLIFPIDHLIEFISFDMTLEPGDIISTGTPAGIGSPSHGDAVTVSVEGVGELTNPGARNDGMRGPHEDCSSTPAASRTSRRWRRSASLDGVTTNPSLLAKEPGDYSENLKKICQIVKGPVSGEVTGDRLRRACSARATTSPKHRPAHDRQGAAHPRRHPGVQGAVWRGHPGQRHAVLLGGAGAALPPRRARPIISPFVGRARRRRDQRHGADPRDRRDLRQLRLHDRSARSPAAATRSTSSKRRGWAPTSPPARRR